MDSNIEKLLELVVEDLPRKSAQQNVLDNPFYRTLIEGALKSLETAATSTFDWKLVAIVKLLQTWYRDKSEDVSKRKPEQMFNFEQTQYPSVSTYPTENWGGNIF